MDMAMDVNWCLTCSKRTLDSRTPYCSEQCRQGDLNVTTPDAQALIPLSSCVRLPKSPLGHTASPPPLEPVVPPVVVTPSSETTSNTTPVLTGLRKPPLRVRSGNDGLSKSSGATTPLAPDTALRSSSDSSDNEGVGLKAKMRTGFTARPTATRASRAPRASLPAEFNRPFKTPSPPFPAKSPSCLSSKQYALGKHTQSPASSVAAAIASPSSSRSREDIMAWAKAVKSREGDIEVNEEEARNRGSPRARRRHSATNESIIEKEPLSTTPKGPLQPVFAGLTIGRFDLTVKALTSVTSSTAAQSNPNTAPTFSGLGLHSAPARATVSKVNVTALSGEHVNDDNLLFFGGATPTLSTISFSETNEPTIATDNVDHEHVNMITDDQHSACSSHYRQCSTQPRPQYPLTSKGRGSQPAPRPTSVISNFSSYIRSFAPFSLATAPSPQIRTSTTKTIPSTSTSNQASEPITTAAPVPASRVESPTSSPPKELVRSVPMDIIIPDGGPVSDDFRGRQAHSQAQEQANEAYNDRLARSRRSQSRRASRSRSRFRSRSRSRGRSSHQDRIHARQSSYDADLSGTDDEAIPAEDRGRSSLAKVLGGIDRFGAGGLVPPTLGPSQSRSRGRDEKVRSRTRGRQPENPPARG